MLIYSMDTSGWTSLKRGYPASNFPSLWRNVDYLAKNSRLISPNEVYIELEKQDDELLKWAKLHKESFLKLDDEQVAVGLQIVAEFPTLVNPLKQTPDADPFVISLAIVQRKRSALLGDDCIVVSAEKRGSPQKCKIPDVCNQFNIRHFTILDVISKEGWAF
ncbi:hypothetical protein ES703_84193 [subsurface metagenome]